MGSRRLAAVAVVGLLVLTGCGGTEEPEPITVLPVSERLPGPELAGRDLDGVPISLADYEGRTVVVNLWASWCGPCVGEAPELVETARRLRGHGAAVIGLTTRDDPRDAAQFAEQAGLPYPTIDGGPDGAMELGFADSLPSVTVPTTWVIDAQGRVAARILGATTAATIEGVVEDVRRAQTAP